MIRQSLIYLFIRAGSGILAIATLVIFTRMLSPKEYGTYALVMAIATMASAILFQWLNVAVGRFYNMYRTTPDLIVGAASRGFWISTTIGAIVFFSALPFHTQFGVQPILIAMLFIIVVAQGRYDFMLQIANAQRTPMQYGKLSWIKSGGALIFGVMFIHYGLAESGALLGFLFGLVFAVFSFKALCGIAVSKTTDNSKISLDMFRYGFPLTLTFFSNVVVGLSDRYIIGWTLGASAVAPYAAAYDLVQQLIGAIMNILFLAAFPLILHALEKEGDDAARYHLKRLGTGLIYIGLPATIGFCVLSTEIANLVFGAEYREIAGRVMPWIGAAIFVGTFKSYYFDVAFQLRYQTKYQGYIAALMAFVNILLNFIFVPKYGVMGAAWSTLAAFLLGAILSWYLGRCIFILPSLKNQWLGSTIASLVMAVAMWSLPAIDGILGVLVTIIGGILIYIMIILVLNVGNSRKVMILKLMRFIK
jgi:O-antigen/teichoic acid export membrane protein